MSVAVSLVVCTFDRPALLARMLASCERVAPPRVTTWELVVVDNGGNAGTRGVTESFAGRLPLRVVGEPEPGKSRALNAGVAAARGALLLFADDDVELRAGWLEAFDQAARRVPEAGWFGGRSIPRWGEGAPRWALSGVPTALRGYCCHYDLGDEPRFYTADDLMPIGACMAVRAATFAQIGGYDTRFGPKGVNRGVGDDTELAQRALLRGIPGYYVPEAVVDHFVPAERLRLSDLVRYGRIKGRQQAEMTGGGLSSPRLLLRAASQAVRGIAQRAMGRPELAAVCTLNVGLAVGAAFGRGGASR